MKEIKILGILILLFFSSVYLYLFFNNRKVRSFLYFSICSFSFAIYFITLQKIMVGIGGIIFIIAISRSFTIESGYYRYFKRIPWYEVIFMRKVRIKELTPVSKRFGIKIGILLILLSFFPVFLNSRYPNLIVLLSGVSTIFYSLRYLK